MGNDMAAFGFLGAAVFVAVVLAVALGLSLAARHAARAVAVGLDAAGAWAAGVYDALASRPGILRPARA